MGKLKEIQCISSAYVNGFIKSASAMHEIGMVLEKEEIELENAKIYSNGRYIGTVSKIKGYIRRI
ncbi:hypothetical protein FC976_13085 [Clostridium sporogenes]|uniref:hypothetical protein n=1 Tax=Clostridium sporogenes TaxID=1509 RepID=UPI0013D58850|nr:hypothetical protein [Clostridium sporogenes]NFH48129.1 hypothetical protein [Clostridium sporogenes]